MRKYLLIVSLYAVVATSVLSGQTPDPIVRFTTSLGNIDVQLSPSDAPLTVANFLSYVDTGSYNESFFHRSVPGFVIQGGGYYLSDNSIEEIVAGAAVTNEYALPNVRGTLALAKTAESANSGTDQWFFNLVDNTITLDTVNNGGFTVFGHIVNSGGFAVMDAIAALQVLDASSSLGADFSALPVTNYSGGTGLSANNLVYVTSLARLASHPSFFDDEVSAGNAVNYLSFANGNFFGYYSYLSDANYIYHFDLGYEYVFDANDGQRGIYLYDFASGDFFYTSPTFPFPYLYNFTFDAVLYYFPDTTSAGHYTTGPRYFANLATGAIITR